jgi:retinol dehydrogenase-13
MKKKSKFFKYFKEYKWSNIFAMIKNNGLSAKICARDFKDKLVVITGTTSGIGYKTAKIYASRGANIITINRSKEKADKVCQEIEKEFHVKCKSLIADEFPKATCGLKFEGRIQENVL